MFSGLLDSGTGGERDFLWKSTFLKGSARGTVADLLMEVKALPALWYGRDRYLAIDMRG